MHNTCGWGIIKCFLTEGDIMTILDKADSINDYVTQLRRYFHQYPELSGQEFRTPEKITQVLDSLGIGFRKVGNTSLIASLSGAKKGNTVALRCDTIYIRFEGVSGHGSSPTPGQRYHSSCMPLCYRSSGNSNRDVA